jgi:hypothetical protein
LNLLSHQRKQIRQKLPDYPHPALNGEWSNGKRKGILNRESNRRSAWVVRLARLERATYGLVIMERPAPNS